MTLRVGCVQYDKVAALNPMRRLRAAMMNRLRAQEENLRTVNPPANILHTLITNT